MTRFFFLVILLAGVSSAFAQSADNDFGINQAKPQKAAVDEIHVQQETGKATQAKKSPVTSATPSRKAPEAGATPSATSMPVGAISPNTCDPKNSSSEACY